MEEPEVRAYKRYAGTLFSLCLIILVVTWFLNRTIAENEVQFSGAADWYQRTTNMLAKIHAYRALNGPLFQDLTLSALSGGRLTARKGDFYAEELPDPFWVQSDPLTGEPVFYLPTRPTPAVTTFGDEAAAIVATIKGQEQRTKLLTEAIAANFDDATDLRILDLKAASHLARVENKEEWPNIVNWILFSDWPDLGAGFYTLRPLQFPHLSYSNTVNIAAGTTWNNLLQLGDLLRQVDPAEAERILNSYWGNAYFAESEAATHVGPQISLPGPLSMLRVADLLMVAGPLVGILQVLFFIFWDRVKSKPFSFPAFASPNDPLGSAPKGLSEFTQRAVWLIFLILPPLILSFGFLTRFDLTSVPPLIYLHPSTESWLNSLIGYHTNEALSLLLDSLDLIFLATSLSLVIHITSRLDSEKRTISRLWRVNNFAVLLPPVAWLMVWFVVNPFHGGGVTMWLFVIFGVIWATVFAMAIRKKSRLIVTLSTAWILLLMIPVVISGVSSRTFPPDFPPGPPPPPPPTQTLPSFVALRVDEVDSQALSNGILHLWASDDGITSLEVQIYDLNGKIIIDKIVSDMIWPINSTVSDMTLTFNGLDLGGHPLVNGSYLYRVIVHGDYGQMLEAGGVREFRVAW